MSLRRGIVFFTSALLLSTAYFASAPTAVGAATSTNWAVVSSAGTLVRGHNATAAVRLNTGSYSVTFGRNITHCAYVATAGDTGAGAVSGPVEVTTALRAGTTNAVFVQTFVESTTAATLTDEPFHLAVQCGAKRFFGVFAADGTKVRGQNITSSTHLSVGAYEVVFNKDVHKCAFEATLGTTGAGSISNPGEISVAGRAGNVDAVFIRIADQNNTTADSSFHLSVECGSAHLIGVIEATGTKARGANVVSSQKLSSTVNAGTYEVIFNRNVAVCAYFATVGVSTNGGSVTSPVTITTATRAGNVDGVFLFVHTVNGATIDVPFHLTVEC
jgi:hypothetical protein